MDEIKEKKGFICDMDGVIYHGNRLLQGVVEFVNWLKAENKQFVFLTNSSERSPKEISQKLFRLGVEVDESHFHTSALATAGFLSWQHPGCSAYVIGETGLTNALYNAGISMNEINPDYVVVGETRSYNFEKIEHAIRLVVNGAKLIGTNPDLTGPSESGIVPATRALIAPIEMAAGRQAYYIGKPNPLMMRHALRKIGCKREETIIIGDRMDTDIIAGIESEIDTLLVLSGVSTMENIRLFPYRPKYIMKGIYEILGL